MKRKGHIIEEIVSIESLYSSYKKAKLGSHGKVDAIEYGFNLERNLFYLQTQLKNNTWTPHPYHYFKIMDPKERIISVAHFEDRIVHHAVVRQLELIYEPCFYHHSYATRKNKGVHKAIQYAQAKSKQNSYYLKCDVEKYFDTIDHGVLLSLLGQKIKDDAFLTLLDKIIKNGNITGRTLPVGNLTSQFFGNVYLNGLDHWIARSDIAYVRYMDDFVIFSKDLNFLKKFKMEIENYLHDFLRLRLKNKSIQIHSCAIGIPFLGAHIYPNRITLRSASKQRYKRRILSKLEKYHKGIIDEKAMQQSLISYCGIFERTNSNNYLKKIIG
jgi:RNA-directed DNA polymerase